MPEHQPVQFHGEADDFQQKPPQPEDMGDFLLREMARLGLDIPLQDPHLQVISILGAGANGQVTVEQDLILGRNIAVKTIHDHLRFNPSMVERMVREAQAAAQLEHPNIVPIYSLGISEKKGVYFTMKRLHGDSLRSIIQELEAKNPAYTWIYPMSRRISIFLKICYGIAYAHSMGVLHRDLKPENIRVGEYGEVTIIDWGLVRELNANRRAGQAYSRGFASSRDTTGDISTVRTSNPTIDGEIAGTPRYMSPEQANAKNSNLDVRSDIYSLGIILYELLTCHNPFQDLEENRDIINAVRRGEFPRPRQLPGCKKIPVELEAICLKALSLSRTLRYQTVKRMISDIFAYQDNREVTAYHAGPIRKIMKYLSRRPIATAVLLTIFFTLITIYLLLHFYVQQ